MAAHIKTYFEQVLAVKNFDLRELESYQYALSYAQLGDNLEEDDWRLLVYEDEVESFLATIRQLQPKYEEQWEALGKPCTAEEWQRAKYPPLEV